ncbi:MAG: selenide, water dikinase SelD [Chloroflexota bacterium]
MNEGPLCLTAWSEGTVCELDNGEATVKALFQTVGARPPGMSAVCPLDENLALVAATSVLPPPVDAPYTCGALVVADALNQIYALGARPTLAFSLCALPANLPLEAMEGIARGLAEKAAEAGATLATGQVVPAEKLVFGLATVGLAEEDGLISPAGASPGDSLLLTKPLGTGIVATAAQLQVEGATAHLNRAVEWMLRLNRGALQAMQETGVRAAVYVGRNGLLGHAYEMAHRSEVGIRIHAGRVPFHEGARGICRGMALPLPGTQQ